MRSHDESCHMVASGERHERLWPGDVITDRDRFMQLQATRSVHCRPEGEAGPRGALCVAELAAEGGSTWTAPALWRFHGR
jgi:hypothetical protein